MLDLFYTFISYFFNIVDFLAYYVLLSHKLTSRFSKKTQLIAYCITYLLWFSAELSTKIFPNIPLKLLFLLLFFFALLTLYKDNLYKSSLDHLHLFYYIFRRNNHNTNCPVNNRLFPAKYCREFGHSSIRAYFITPTNFFNNIFLNSIIQKNIQLLYKRIFFNHFSRRSVYT